MVGFLALGGRCEFSSRGPSKPSMSKLFWPLAIFLGVRRVEDIFESRLLSALRFFPEGRGEEAKTG